MQSRWFNIAVVTLWLTTMGWLVCTKILPALLVGEPPSRRTILEAQRGTPPVGWDLAWNGKRLGWALNLTDPQPGDLTEIRSRVHFDYLPLRDLVPAPLMRMFGPTEDLEAELSTNINSQLVYDSFGRLSRFASIVRFSGLTDAISVRGSIDGPKMILSMHSGSFTLDRELPITPKTTLSDALAPQTHLPGLRQGQTWTVQLYSPLHPPTEPLEVLQVAVEGLEPIFWEGRPVDTWLVVYRSDPGSGGRNAGNVRGRMWVDRQGMILQQQVTVMQSTLTFTRMSEARANGLALEVAHDIRDDAQHLFGSPKPR